MPFIDLKLSGRPDAGLARRAAAVVTELTASVLGKDPRLTAVAVRFVDAAHWFVAGEALFERRARSYHLVVSITDETNTKAEKARYLAVVHEAMAKLLGGVDEHSYVLVHDVRAAAYGYGGETQEHRHVAAALRASSQDAAAPPARAAA